MTLIYILIFHTNKFTFSPWVVDLAKVPPAKIHQVDFIQYVFYFLFFMGVFLLYMIYKKKINPQNTNWHKSTGYFFPEVLLLSSLSPCLLDLKCCFIATKLDYLCSRFLYMLCLSIYLQKKKILYIKKL